MFVVVPMLTRLRLTFDAVRYLLLVAKKLSSAEHVEIMFQKCTSTGCGRKNSLIWEANKNQTKRDNISFLKLLTSIYNAVLKFKNYVTQVAAFIVDTLTEPLPVLFMTLRVIPGGMAATSWVIASLRP
jgi:hypothetical protein